MNFIIINQEDLKSEIKALEILLQPVFSKQNKYDYTNVLNVLGMIYRTALSLYVKIAKLKTDVQNDELLNNCDIATDKIRELRNIVISSQGIVNSDIFNQMKSFLDFINTKLNSDGH